MARTAEELREQSNIRVRRWRANPKNLEKRIEANQSYYARNKERMRVRSDVRKTDIRIWFLEFKKTQKCNRCGFSDYRALQFHHLNRDEKFEDVSQLAAAGYGVNTILKEIAKCEVLCGNCHHIETYDTNGRYEKLRAKQERPHPAAKYRYRLTEKRVSTKNIDTIDMEAVVA